jgi:hypothetical protein
MLGELLSGLLSGIVLEMDKSAYQVGERPIYRITGAPAGYGIAWTSFKDGESTGEYQAAYGQTIGSDGTFQAEGGVWTPDQIGLWQKQVVLIPPDGDWSKIQTSQVIFTVSEAGQTEPSGAGLFDMRVMGIPVWMLGAGAIGAFLLFRR